MSWHLLMVAALSVLYLTIPSRAAHAAGPVTSLEKGISYAAWWSGAYTAPGADLSLRELQSTGANWIALIVTGHQDGIAATTIDITHVSTPTDDDLVHAIDQAHSLGLKVMLKPHLDLFNEVPDGHWRGDIGTGFTSEAQWTAWFDAYKGFIVHYARLAQAHGVEQFCVGTELGGTSRRATDWRSVVAAIRAVYQGPLVYAALKGGEETSVTWWDAVDYIGVDGYYALNDDLSIDPAEQQLETAWAGPIAVLAGLSSSYHKPILLTEIGYRSQHGCSVHPWDSWATSAIDDEEQQYAYEAAFVQLYHQSWLAGMFWWMWSPDPFESGPCDDGFTPHLKPAEDTLRQWYGGTPLPAVPVLLPDYDTRLDIYSDELASEWQNWSWSTGNLNLAAHDQVFEGSKSIDVTLQPWGALSFWHPPVDDSMYYFLEFHIRSKTTVAPHLVAFVTTEDGEDQGHVPVDDCRYIAGGTISVTSWKLVRMRLSDLNATGKRIVKLTVQDRIGQSSSFYIDSIRLLAGKEPGYRVDLPVVTR